MTIIETGIIDNIPYRICKIRHYYTAYIVIPPTSYWYKMTYDELWNGCVEFTYSQFEGPLWVIGWDYAHYGQENTTLEEVKENVNQVILELKEHKFVHKEQL